MWHDGWRFDQGPSLLLLPKLFAETFHELGTSLEDEGVELLRCPTNYAVWFSDGERFELSTDLARMKEQVERWEGKDGFIRYLAWLGEGHTHYELSVRDVLRRNFLGLWDLVRPSFIITGLRIHPLHTIWGRACQYFWSERLRRVFTFATMYMGMSPFDAPATYSLLQYTELAEGIWYPRGGFHAVLDALVRVGERYGVQYRLGTAVRRVLTHPDGETVRGVELESGEVLEADVVVINADLVYAYSNLFPQKRQRENGSSEKTRGMDGNNGRYARSLRAKAGSCSSISFYWSVNRKLPELQTHNIFLADEYRESFDAIFKRQDLPAEPSFYVNVPSRIDPSAAPEGADAVIALVPTGHLRDSRGFSPVGDIDDKGVPRELDWDALVDRARRAVLDTVKARTGCDLTLEKSIVHEFVNDPRIWEEKFNLDKGSILGLSHSFFNVLAFRPATRAKGFRGAYFVGASTHPGTGVPIVLAGSRLTAEQILDDLNAPVPWRGLPSKIQDQGVRQDENTRKLDRLMPPRVRMVTIFIVLIPFWVVMYFCSGSVL